MSCVGMLVCRYHHPGRAFRSQQDNLLMDGLFSVAGNKSATFPLQLLGWEVDAALTVEFSNHTVSNGECDLRT